MKLILSILASVALCVEISCTPMTFSHKPVIDFGKYRSVSVEVSVDGRIGYYSDYLLDELKDISGFSEFVLDSGSADVVIQVDMVTYYEPDFEDDDYDPQADADFVVLNRSGDVIDSGSVSDSSGTMNETVEDVLDEIALRYLAEYRI